MNFKLPVTTSRLCLKRESLSDFERFFEMSKDPQVMKYIGDGSIYHWTLKVALSKFRAGLMCSTEIEPGNLAVYTKHSECYIGCCGIRYSRFLDHIELGYRYCSDAWGNGYATEAATALLAATYQMTPIDRILACTHPDNIASIRVLEKIGFIYSGTKYSRASGRDILIYEICRQTFYPDTGG